MSGFDPPESACIAKKSLQDRRYEPEAVYDRYQELLGTGKTWATWVGLFEANEWIDKVFPLIAKIIDRGLGRGLGRTSEQYAEWRRVSTRDQAPVWFKLSLREQKHWRCLFQVMEEALGKSTAKAAEPPCTCSIRILMQKGCPRKTGGQCEV